MKSGDYETESMSGSTMINEGEILTDKDGNNHLVLHFKPAVINGILAYTTGIDVYKTNDTSLEGGANTKREKFPVNFVLKADNTAVAIVELPKDLKNDQV